MGLKRLVYQNPRRRDSGAADLMLPFEHGEEKVRTP